MTPAALLASARSLIESNPDDFGLIDRCAIYNVTWTLNGDGGTTQIDGSPVASNVPCLIQQKSYRTGALTGDNYSSITHELLLIASSTTRNVKPNYAVVVSARGDSPARRFEQPVTLEETMGPLVLLGVKLKL